MKLGLHYVVSDVPGPRVGDDRPLNAQLGPHMATKVLLVEATEVGAGDVIRMVFNVKE